MDTIQAFHWDTFARPFIIRENPTRANPRSGITHRLTPGTENMMLAYILQKISNWFQFAESNSNSYLASTETDDLEVRLRALELR
jgi:hypothetical protein